MESLAEILNMREKLERAYRLMEECLLCPRVCRKKRLQGEKGECKVGGKLVISSYGPHHGEEDCLRGWRGSGTIFLSGCNLGCIFCQNYTISHLVEGIEITPSELALIMLKLQKMGCHNINFVTPTHFMPLILEGIIIAKDEGLKIPIVWNCGGYESVAALKLLEGIVDIYMPDLKFTNSEVAFELANADDYPKVVKKAIKEMHRQVGDLLIDEQGIAYRGLLVRHLVLPNDMAGTEAALKFLYYEISPNTYVNIMEQYRPCYKAYNNPQINRCITAKEYYNAIKMAKDIGLHRGFPMF